MLSTVTENIHGTLSTVTENIHGTLSTVTEKIYVTLSLHLLPFWPLLLVPSSSPVRSSHLVYRKHPALLMVWPLLSGVVGMMSPLHLPQPRSFRGPGMLPVCHWHTGTSLSLLQMYLHGPACLPLARRSQGHGYRPSLYHRWVYAWTRRWFEWPWASA